MICCVIANYHPMLGVDFHTGFPALIFVPEVPFAPHVVFAMVRFGPWFYADSVMNKEAHDVQTPAGDVMSKIFDIGPFIPHITFPALDHIVWMLIYTVLSSSQGHFGVASVQTSKGPIAVALMLFENPQLDCGTIPTPTGVVLAPNTVVAGLTLGDLIAGLFSMIVTGVITWGLGKLASGITSKVGGFITQKIIGALPPEIGLPAAILATLFPKAMPGAKSLIESVVGWALGSPMGTSASAPPFKVVGKTPFDYVSGLIGNLTGPNDPITDSSSAVGSWVDNHISTNDYFNNSALLPVFPLGPVMVPVQ